MRRGLVLLALALVAALMAAIAPSASASGVQMLNPSEHAGLVSAHDRSQGFGDRGRDHGARPLNPTMLASEKLASAARVQATGRSGVFRSPIGTAAVTRLAPAASLLLNQPGLAATDNSAFDNGTPPDTTGAIGPGHYVEFVNSKVAVYNRSSLGTAASSRALELLTGAPNQSVFDPQIQWDPQGNRWFYVADECTDPHFVCKSGNYLDVGWSKTSDPTDLVNGWCNYFIPTGTQFDDYPKLGHSDNHIVIGTNVFPAGAPNSVSSRIWAVPKPAPYDSLDPSTSACPSSAGTAHYFSGSASSPVMDGSLTSNPLLTSDGRQAATPVPANTMNPNPKGYVVAADEPGVVAANHVMVWHVGGAKTAPTLTADVNIAVTTFTAPPNVPQPPPAPVTDVLDSLDARLTQAVAVPDPGSGGADAIWTQHTVASADGLRSVVRWYELVPSAATKKKQEGTIGDTTDFVFNGAIAPTLAGNEAAIQYNLGGATRKAEIHATFHQSSAPAGVSTGNSTIASSADVDRDFSCPSNSVTSTACRWGDYAGLAPDPVDSHSVWGSNQIVNAASGTHPRWATRNFALTPSGGPSAIVTVPPVFQGKPAQFDASQSRDPDGGTINPPNWDLHNTGIFTDYTGNTPPPQTYNDAPGTTKTVGLQVTDTDQNITDTRYYTFVVRSPAPTASFAAGPSPTTRLNAVTFNGSASKDAEVSSGGIAEYRWDFGDGSQRVTTSPVVTHTYGSVGTFHPTLVVKDSDGDNLLSPSATQSITVVNIGPRAGLSASPGSPQAGDVVTFDATSSTDSDGTIVKFEWDLDGNGTFKTDTGNSPYVARAFANPGTFTVGVRVTDNDGATSSTTRTLQVAPKPAGGGGSSGGTPPPPDLTLRLKASSKAKLARAIQRGLSLSATCSHSCKLALTARIPDRTARKLRTNPTIGGSLASLVGSRGRPLTIKLSKAAGRALGKSRPITVTILVTATDSAGKTASATLTIMLGR